MPSRLATEDDPMEDMEDVEEDEDVDIQRAMSAVKRDLGEDDDDVDEGMSEVSTLPPRRQQEEKLSSHERRMAAFRKEISKLERENVANKPWMLTGESVAPARPENALLEEDLDFERAGKPLPVITQEVNESIEELIKRRILNNEFDEIPRRRPELESSTGTRRGLLDSRRDELNDSKPQKSLAEEYEDDYLRKTDPNFVDKRSETLKKKHADIETQWADLRGQLDALCNWHYRPRPPDMNVEVRTQAPVVRMEEARPAVEAGGEVSGLAPQEVYTPGQNGKTEGEVRTSGGTAIAKEEESRDSRRRRRRRAKEKAHRARLGTGNLNKVQKDQPGNVGKKAQKSQEQNEVVKVLKKGGVKVIGKKGELQNVEGKAASTNAAGANTGAAGYIL